MEISVTIMGNLTRLTGTPWHTEKMTRSDGDERRHRSRCEFYDKKAKYCSQTLSVCYGASHCLYYQEKIEEEEAKLTPSTVKTSSKNSISSEQKTVINKLKTRQTKCKHKTFGAGVVVDVDGKYSIIRFDNGIEKKIDTEFAVRNSLITLM